MLVASLYLSIRDHAIVIDSDGVVGLHMLTDEQTHVDQLMINYEPGARVPPGTQKGHCNPNFTFALYKATGARQLKQQMQGQQRINACWSLHVWLPLVWLPLLIFWRHPSRALP